MLWLFFGSPPTPSEGSNAQTANVEDRRCANQSVQSQMGPKVHLFEFWGALFEPVYISIALAYWRVRKQDMFVLGLSPR